MENKPTSGNASKRKQNGYSSAKLHAKRNRKRREAEDRQFEYDKKSTAQKLKELGATGSNRQRARLTALLAKEKEAAKVKKQAKAAVAA
jgi:hypothetical protein